MTELADAVRATPPEEFTALSDTHHAALAGLVSAAAHARSGLIDRAIDDSLRHIPGILRGTVKRALGV
jgi:hypothetical protein